MTLHEIYVDYLLWARDHSPHLSRPQAIVKLMEEVGELCHGSHRSDDEEMKDAVVDIFIVLLKVAGTLGMDFESAVKDTWEKVRARDYVKFPYDGRTR